MQYALAMLLATIMLTGFAPAATAQDRKDAFGDPLPPGAIARIGTLRYRLPHARGTEVAQLSSDGKLLATVTGFNNIEIWELPAWKRRHVIKNLNETGAVQNPSLIFSADNQKLVAFDGDTQSIFLFDVTTGKVIKNIKAPKEKMAESIQPTIRLSKDEKTLVCIMPADSETPGKLTVEVWDLVKEKLVRSFTVAGDEGSMTESFPISSDGQHLAHLVIPDPPDLGRLWKIELWNLHGGKRQAQIEPGRPVNSLAYSPDGKWLAASLTESILHIYDAKGKLHHGIDIRNDSTVHMKFSPDGAALYLSMGSGEIQVWNPATGKLTATYANPKDCQAHRLAFPPDGKVLALGFNFCAVNLWEAKSGKLHSPRGLLANPAYDLAFSPKGEMLIATDSLAWWSPRTGAKIRDVTLQLRRGDRESLEEVSRFQRTHEGDWTQFTISRNADMISMKTNQGFAASFFDLKSGKLLYQDDGLADRPSGLLRYFDGDRKAASVHNKRVQVWNARTGKDAMKFDIPLGEGEQANEMGVSQNGKYFAFAYRNEKQERVFVWDAEKKKVARDWPFNGHSLTFSPDGEWFAFAKEIQDCVHLTRLGASKESFTLRLESEWFGRAKFAFSPDSRLLAFSVASIGEPFASRIHVYEIASKKIRHDLVGHTSGTIDHLVFSHDGSMLASGASDTTVLVWNMGLRAFAPKPADKEPSVADLADCFQTLTNSDAELAFRNMIGLAQSPKQSVKLLDSKIAPAEKFVVGEKAVRQFIADLGSAQFPVRAKANEVLRKLGGSAELELRAALPKAKEVETKRRIEELLARIASHEWSPEEVMHARAVEVAEAIATPEARALLTRWAGGDSAAVLTREASKALGRADAHKATP